MLYVYLYILFIQIIPNFFLSFSEISKLCGLSVSLFNLLQISKNFSNIFIEKKLCTSGPAQFKPMLFKGQLDLLWE